MKLDQKLISALIVLVVLLLIGTVYFHQVEEWSYVDSFYFSTMTLTTVGYGDLTPATDYSKIFTSFYAIFGIGAMLYTIGTIIGKFVFRQEKRFEHLLSRLHIRKGAKIKEINKVNK